MKTNFILVVIIFTLFFSNTYSQITLDSAYNTGTNHNTMFSIVNLSHSGYKYVDYNFVSQQITLYNMNHTIYKVINIPITGVNGCINVSETLFNTNPLDIEYLVVKTSMNNILSVYIFDESGNILLQKDSVYFASQNYGHNQNPVYSTTNGTKLLLANQNNGNVYIYNLPGNLVCNYCNSDSTVNIDKNSIPDFNKYLFSYPNPSLSSMKIKYKLPDNIQTATISFYNLQGKELKQMQIDNKFEEIFIDKSTLGIDSGIYIYKIFKDNKIIATDKIIFE